VNKKWIMIGIVLAVVLGGTVYGITRFVASKSEEKAKHETLESKERGGHEKEEASVRKHGESKTVAMSLEKQKQNGIVVTAAKKERLAGAISVTGKVEVNADRVAHISPRIPGKITAVKAFLGDSVGLDQVLVTLDSIELGEALNRYQQSKTRLTLMSNNLERVKALVDKKIAARKDILQAETEYQMTLTALHTDEERLLLYGLSPADLNNPNPKGQLLPVRSPIRGVITEKRAIMGELADPSKSLYTVADLSSVWVLVDIHEKNLAQIHKGQDALVTVGAFPELKFRGRINYIADVVDDVTRTVKARVEVHNAGRKLKPEMFATVTVALPADSPPVLAIPEDALQDLEGKRVLFVAENGTEFVPRSLELGRISGGKVEVTGGLKEGERYAVKGGFLLKSELKKGEMTEDKH